MEKVYLSSSLTASFFGLIYLAKCPLPVNAQVAPKELPPRETIQQTIPRNTQPNPIANPVTEDEKPEITVPNSLNNAGCGFSASEPLPNYKDRFFLRNIKVVGNSVLHSEIDEIIKDSGLKYRTVTFEDLVCLRSRITQLYLDEGYVTSGAFLSNNQNLSDGVATIQIVEGELEDIVITGLERLQENYLRSRLKLATQKPLNKDDLETGLQLLVINPLFKTVDAELTAGTKAGSNVLLLDIEQANSFTASIGVDNYRAPSIGELQGSVSFTHGNLFEFGDRLSAQYGFTEGLDIYNFSYAVPWNAYDGTLGFRFDQSKSGIIDEEFRDLDIDSNTKTYSVDLRQPLTRNPNQEFTLGFGLDVRRRSTSLGNEPFSFSLGAEDGQSNTTVLRFAQDWVKRDTKTVLAARSQFNFGIDAFDATINNTGTDGKFFAWQGQFQWVEQLSPRVLLISRFGGQFTDDALLSSEKFSLGGVNTVRGYGENQLVTDNGVLGTVELQIPVTKNPNTLKLNPFIEFGKGWNVDEPDPDDSLIASAGLGINWQFVRNKCLRYWEDNKGTGQKDIYKRVTALRKEFPFVKNLNSTACQQACERTWTAILKFYTNCKKQIPGKKGYPRYSKKTRSVEFKKSGWKLNRDAKRITFTDGNNIGELKLIGSRDLYYFQEWQIQRVRIVRKADGYFVQLLLKLDPRDITLQLEPTGKAVAIDVGLKYFYADSNSETVDCPKYYRKAEKRLNLLNRRKSKKFRKGQKQSSNYIKARKRYALKHLRVSRQREEFAKEKALRLIQSNDLIAYEDLKVKNLVRNKKLAKSINDAAWSQLRKWIEYFGLKYGRLTIAVPPHYTSSDCPKCGKRVKKSGVA